jgi:hypothetical protein
MYDPDLISWWVTLTPNPIHPRICRSTVVMRQAEHNDRTITTVNPRTHSPNSSGVSRAPWLNLHRWLYNLRPCHRLQHRAQASAHLSTTSALGGSTGTSSLGKGEVLTADGGGQPTMERAGPAAVLAFGCGTRNNHKWRGRSHIGSRSRAKVFVRCGPSLPCLEPRQRSRITCPREFHEHTGRITSGS